MNAKVKATLYTAATFVAFGVMIAVMTVAPYVVLGLLVAAVVVMLTGFIWTLFYDNIK